MAVFGPLPGFARASVLLTGLNASARPAPIAAFLRRLVPGGTPRAWRVAYAAVGMDTATVPPHVALAAWAREPGGVPSQGPVLDLVNAFGLQHSVPAAAYDLAEVASGIRLRPSRGIEVFTGLDGGVMSPPLGEIILADDSDVVLARLWHGAQGRQFVPRLDSQRVLVHVDLVDEVGGAPLDEAASLAESFSRLAAGFLGARCQWHVLHRGAPTARWE